MDALLHCGTWSGGKGVTSVDRPDPASADDSGQASSAELGASIDASLFLLAEFTERAAALGVTVERLPDSSAAAARIAEVMAEVGAARIVISREIEQAAPELLEELSRAGMRWSPPEETAELQHELLGASFGRLAVAETGSVLLAEHALTDRAIGMLVSVQVILCPTESLVPSLDEAAPVLRELALIPGGAYATLVTGPSRTADIERVLTVGVQGPARVIVFFVDHLPAP